MAGPPPPASPPSPSDPPLPASPLAPSDPLAQPAAPDVAAQAAGERAAGERAALRLLTVRWLLRHLLVIVLVVTFLALASWQYSRAVAGNALSWAYTLQWPLFAGFVVAMWVRAVRDELRGTDHEPNQGPPPLALRPGLPPLRSPRPAPPAPTTAAPATAEPAESGSAGSGSVESGSVGSGSGSVGSGAVGSESVPTTAEDLELVAYNRYLAWLNANPDRRPSEYPG